MTYGLTTDKNVIDEVIQEFYLYMLQMNPNTLKGIYEKDGEKGLIRYGAVVIRRSLQSKNSPYYYKYKKYYEYHTTTTIECLSADNTQYTIKDKELVKYTSKTGNIKRIPKTAMGSPIHKNIVTQNLLSFDKILAFTTALSKLKAISNAPKIRI
mgnify:CR=1 FL=1